MYCVVTAAPLFERVIRLGGNGVGGYPEAGLIRGSDGALYGTTSNGGVNDLGTVFRLSVPMPPVFQSAAVVAGGVTFTWSAVAGQNYQIQSINDLGSTNWQNSGVSFTATDGTIFAADIVTPGGRQFYRAVLVQ